MSNNNYKRILKNASMLYFRILLTIVVTLYTSRVILQTLGIEDYGIYNVVAGFVMMLGFLHGAMSSATQRFLSFEMGKQKDKNMSSIFSMSMNIHILIAIFVFLLGETVGLWFLSQKMTIPTDRIYAAQWVFHLSLISFMVTIVSVPYNALIISHEQMGVFAWVSIIDVTLKLLIVFMLPWFDIDKLVLYGIFSLLVVFSIFLVYRSYCKNRYPEAHFQLYWDRKIFRTMLSFTGWNLWGNIAYVLSSQGTNILLNIYFGPAVNAARAVAIQVSGALNRFVQSLQVAVNPQIIKSYADNNLVYMNTLVSYSAKYNFFTLLLLSVPIFYNINIVLDIWLGSHIPSNTPIFVRLIIINILIDSISAPLMASAQASGNIKIYQSVVGGALLLTLPISYFLLNDGFSAQTVFYVSILTSILAFVLRLIVLKRLVKLPVLTFMKEVLSRCLITLTATITLIYCILIRLLESLNFWYESIITLLCALICIIIFGLSKQEKQFIGKKIKFLMRT